MRKQPSTLGTADMQTRGGAAEAAAADVAAAAASGFVFDDACRTRLSGILARFCGTHRFHNFTVKVPDRRITTGCWL